MAVLNFYHICKVIPEGAVYIGRGNAKLGLIQSKFANPFPAKDKDDRDRVVELYRKWLWKQIKENVITKEDLMELRGKDLVCYCSPKSCHGDILMKAVEWICKEEPIDDKKKDSLNKLKP